ncbi:hypothetical protein ACWCXH_33720 [Kitasatospora sp. NPDC001660]
MNETTEPTTSALPAVIPAQPVALTDQHPAARALRHDISRAAGAVRAMRHYGQQWHDDTADVSVVAYAAIVTSGETPAQAMQASVDWMLHAPDAEVHSISLARVPGHRADAAEFHVTLAVSYPDQETGEYTGDTHHAAGAMAHVVVGGSASDTAPDAD